MRRAPIVITATLVGTAGVLLFKPLPPSSSVAAPVANDPGATTGSSDDATPPPATAPSTGPSAASSPTTSSGASKRSTTVTGDLETDRYGDTQVSATITNGRITAVTTVKYNDGDPRSAFISQQAIPILRQEILARQTAAVDAVGGATYTSNAYEASLQSALDKAGYRSPDGSKAGTDLESLDAGLFGH
jgi:uncharacterized protein with FMN-binding domain